MMVQKRPRRGVKPVPSGESRVEALFQALHAGALAFLPLSDAVSVLNSSRLLRFDRDLPLLALAFTGRGGHLLRHCTSDWMDARPSFFQVAALLDDVCTEHDRDAMTSEHRIRDVKRFHTELDFLDERRGQGAALLTALHMIETLIVPICYREDVMNRYGDTCTARPVVIPLNIRRSNRQQLTVTDVRDALNEWTPAFGDNFTGLPSEYAHVSDLGAHWESVKVVTVRRSTQTTCEFCDSARNAIKEYRKEARAALRRFNEFLRDKRQEWRAEGLDSAEMHQRRSELKAEFFPEDSYPDINFADGQDDVILADICESSRFEMNPFSGMCSGFDRFDDDVYNALREEYMGLCETLCQPLRRTLNKSCFLIGRRVYREWMSDDEGGIKGEMVAGVTAGGVLVGVFVATRRAE